MALASIGCYFITIILPAVGIHFVHQSVTSCLCFYGDETYPRIIDSTSAKTGDEHVTYFLDGTPEGVYINTSTGYIYMNDTWRMNASSSIHVNKHAVNRNGDEAVLKLTFLLNGGKLFNETCPKTLYFNVRQIAPVGEEIGQIECRDRTRFNGAIGETHFEELLVSEGSYAPFDITKEGVVVVSEPLVLYNSIRDITIFNVMLTNDVTFGDVDNCTRIVTRVTTLITVKETDCQTNWTYNLTQNLFVDAKPLAVILTSSIPSCMQNCTTWKSPSCRSFMFNVLTETCFILNDTETTEPNKTRIRMGYFFYRKQCNTEILPALPLRNLAEKANKNHSLTERTHIAEEFMSVIEELSNNTRDIEKAVETLGLLVKPFTDGPIMKDDMKKFVQAVSRCTELLFDVVSDKQVYKQSAFRLFGMFDDLVSLVSRQKLIVPETFGILGNVTSLQLVNTSLTDVSTNPALLCVSGGQSGVTMQTLSSDHRVAVGILKVVSMFTLPEWSINSSEFTDEQDGSLYYLVSHVVSVISSPYPTSQSFEVQLDIFTENREFEPAGDRICAFLSSNQTGAEFNVWGRSGCSLAGFNHTHTRCVCSHLTNFAVLMQVKAYKLTKVHEVSLSVVTTIGCCVSIAALTTSLLVLLWLRFQTDRYVLLINLTVAIILAQVVFLTGIDAVGNKILCRLIAICLHYLYLTVFTLMLAQGVHLYHKLYRAFAVESNLSMFLMLGWGSPLGIIAISLITNLAGYGTEERCWLSTNGAIWAFVGPALTVIAINMAILVMVIRTFLGVKFNSNKTDVEKFKASVRATAVLLPLLGITWMFGVAAVNGSTVVFQYVFAILNSLQGLFIFLFHVVFNEEVREACGRYKGRVVTTISNIAPPATGPQRTARNK